MSSSRKSIEIIPAILPADFVEVVEKVEAVKGLVKTVQIDICDGQFVPSVTWPYKKRDDTFEHLIHESEGMPAWDKLDYEFDLMVNHPEKVVDEWVLAGATRIILHAEVKGDIGNAIETIAGRCEIGLALNMETPISVVDAYKYSLQFVQFMGIDKIGFQGQSFDETVLGRIKEFRLAHPMLPVSVDGGVSLETAPQLIAAGADRLVVGSALFRSENIIETLHQFRDL